MCSEKKCKKAPISLGFTAYGSSFRKLRALGIYFRTFVTLHRKKISLRRHNELARRLACMQAKTRKLSRCPT
jgi:hypothetical protein